MSTQTRIKRREFLSACGMASAAAVGAAGALGAQQPPADARQPSLAPPTRRYRLSVQIVECKAGKCPGGAVGDTFAYPADRGRMCPWLLDSMNAALRVLEHGGTLPWRYTGTPYEKVIDPDGITTEFIRCPDPTDAGVVAKITRTRV